MNAAESTPAPLFTPLTLGPRTKLLYKSQGKKNVISTREVFVVYSRCTGLTARSSCAVGNVKFEMFYSYDFVLLMDIMIHLSG